MEKDRVLLHTETTNPYDHTAQLLWWLVIHVNGDLVIEMHTGEYDAVMAGMPVWGKRWAFDEAESHVPSEVWNRAPDERAKLQGTQ